MKYVHLPVLVQPVLNYVLSDQDSLFLDCTLGEGGHSEAVLKRFSTIHVCGLDRDGEIIEVAKERLQGFDGRFRGFNINFTEAAKLKDEGYLFDSALIDLGISVYHYKISGRGFTFSKNEPLDMRLDEHGMSAAEIVNGFSEGELRNIFYKYGEERFAPAIARKIVQERAREEIVHADQLASIVEKAIPPKFRSKHIHPATKVFQALRIAVNNEFENIEQGIPAVLSVLKPGGKLGVITFHSLEDRIVKTIFAELNKSCVCPPKLPVCVCGKVREVKIIGKSIVPDEEECKINPPSRSARLRVVEKL